MSEFAQRVLQWFDVFGRHDLPWQGTKDPYRVWVSEIMLQQTQVVTVIPYYQRFMTQFPTVASLAAADLNEVLQLWTGLGYYARARNLHRAALQIMAEHQGNFPHVLAEVMALPGIGRSTAGAILSICWDEPVAILDGNVKRVLCRQLAQAGHPSVAAVEQALWAEATARLPQARYGDYTQAMMDLGATLCTRRLPRCDACPVHTRCRALAQGDPLAYPEKKQTKPLPVKQTHCLVLSSPQGVWLEQRPLQGLWGGLYGFPEGSADEQHAKAQAVPDCQEHAAPWQFRHTFSHYHLDIHVLHYRMAQVPEAWPQDEHQRWYDPAHPRTFGLAAATVHILTQLGYLT
jgi:A/G-specific adenine glycosylase